MSAKDKLVKGSRKKSPIKRLLLNLWNLIQSFFNFIGSIFENISRRSRFSISFKITFTFLGLFIFFYSIFSFHSVFMFLIAFPLIAIFGSRAVRYLLKPVDDVTKLAQRLTGSDLKERIDIQEAQDELRDLSLTLNSMLDRIDQSMEDQRAFISHASHELRTPLSVIKGYSDILSRWGAEDPVVRDESIKAIKEESESMKVLVEKLLMISRMDYGQMISEKRILSLSDLLKETCHEFRLIKDQDIALEEYLPETMVYGDADLIKELARIFLDNAYKYAFSATTIQVSCGTEGKRAYFTVRDHGQGIEREHLARIFEPFYRADDSRTRATGGTGLGLSIAKKISTLLDAELTILSELGQGTLIRCIFSELDPLQLERQPEPHDHQRRPQSHSHL